MRAVVFLGDHTLDVRDVPEPVSGPGEVQVQVARAAVCGTDLHRFHTRAAELETLPGGEPLIAGHEPVGWISRLGAGVDHVKIGDRVLLAGVIGCGCCAPCLAGYNVACEAGPCGLNWRRHGCNADYVVMPAGNAIPLDDALDFDAATVLTCAGGTAYTALREAGVKAGQRIVVVGLGPVGLCTVILAHAMGCVVAGIEPMAERRALAVELGAEFVVDPDAEDAARAVRRWARDRGGDVVVECVGRGRTQSLAIACCANRGTVAFAGLGKEPIQLDVTATLIGRHGLRLQGVAASPIRYFPELVALATRCAGSLKRMITHRFPLERAREALTIMETGQCGKVLLEVSHEFVG